MSRSAASSGCIASRTSAARSPDSWERISTWSSSGSSSRTSARRLVVERCGDLETPLRRQLVDHLGQVRGLELVERGEQVRRPLALLGDPEVLDVLDVDEEGLAAATQPPLPSAADEQLREAPLAAAAALDADVLDRDLLAGVVVLAAQLHRAVEELGEQQRLHGALLEPAHVHQPGRDDLAGVHAGDPGHRDEDAPAPRHLDDEPDDAGVGLAGAEHGDDVADAADLVPQGIEDGEAREPGDEDPIGRSAHADQAIARPCAGSRAAARRRGRPPGGPPTRRRRPGPGAAPTTSRRATGRVPASARAGGPWWSRPRGAAAPRTASRRCPGRRARSGPARAARTVAERAQRSRCPAGSRSLSRFAASTPTASPHSAVPGARVRARASTVASRARVSLLGTTTSTTPCSGGSSCSPPPETTRTPPSCHACQASRGRSPPAGLTQTTPLFASPSATSASSSGSSAGGTSSIPAEPATPLGRAEGPCTRASRISGVGVVEVTWGDRRGGPADL